VTSTILNDPHRAASEIDRVLSSMPLINDSHGSLDSG